MSTEQRAALSWREGVQRKLCLCTRTLLANHNFVSLLDNSVAAVPAAAANGH
jgi:hypothetical protein